MIKALRGSNLKRDIMQKYEQFQFINIYNSSLPTGKQS